MALWGRFVLTLAPNLTSGSIVVQRDVMWVAVDERSFEHLRLAMNEEGFVADGLIVRLSEGNSHRIGYQIEGDAAWRIRKLALWRLDQGSSSLVLHSDGEGHWTDGAGESVPALEGCRDIDIHASPFTNTLAIRRLALEQGEAADISVAFVTAPALEVHAVRQRYTLLQPSPGGGIYRYQSLESDFVADLPVDADGLLIEYPGYFRRAWSR